MMIARYSRFATSRNSLQEASSVVARGNKVLLRWLSGDNNSFSSFTEERMKADKRYATTVEVPESLQHDTYTKDNKFSIRGAFREGRAAYLDFSATTPIDPRVLDAMLPYMVSFPPTIIKGELLVPLVPFKYCFSRHPSN
jgi:hypothetical protein